MFTPLQMRLRISLFQGPGGLSRLLPIAVPMIISQLFDTAMMFVDRLFLSRVSPLAMASCMSGGLTAFLCGQLAFGVVVYCSTLVAHRYGAGRRDECPVVVMQAVWVACAAYPLVLLAGRLGIRVFALAGHTPEQIALESAYFRIIIAATIFGLLRAAFSGFFAGIGKTRIIMFGNALAMLTNIVGNYVLIFGKWGAPALGIVGAALGTALAAGVMMITMAVAFFIYVRQPSFRGRRLISVDRAAAFQLIRYGLPNGIEGFVSIFSFTTIVLLIHAMGEEVAAAVTMMFNWELVSFFPMIGLQIGVATLVGQNMGARNIPGAKQAVHAGLALVLAYTGLLALCFVLVPRLLLSPFTHEASEEIIRLAVPMLQLTAVYLMFDGASLIFSGALRGAGDTLWAMLIGGLFHCFLVVVCGVAIYVCRFGPVMVWASLCGAILFGCLAFLARYRQGHWQRISMVTAAD